MIEQLRILLYYLKARRAMKIKSRAKLEAYQHKRLEYFFKGTLSRMPLYQNLIDGPLSSFPIVDKDFVQQNFSELNSHRLDYEAALDLAMKCESYQQLTVGMSSGTSGRRGVFLVNRKERLCWLGTILAKALPGSVLSKHRVALFLVANSELYRTTNHNHRMDFRFFDLKDGFEENFNTLLKFNPTILIAPAQVLRLIADRVDHEKSNFWPQKVFSVGEVLDRNDAEKIGFIFKQKVHQIYQCTEGFLGISCSYGTIHLNEEYVFIEKEWLDKETGRFNPIITDFTRTSQAMVRYRMNDVLVLKDKPCPCGSPLTAIEKIEGRCDDILTFRGKNGQKEHFFPDDLRSIILDSDCSVEDFRLRQRNVNSVAVSLKTKKPIEAGQAVTFALQEAFTCREILPVIIKVEEWLENNDLVTKLRRIQKVT